MWFKNSIVYHILVDRFAGYNPHRNWQKPIFMGGNLKGVLNKLPYLHDLGINTLWLSPINETSAYHGYHITDFYEVDIHFGTENDLTDLIEAAHRLNIRVILDFVPNHCSVIHPYFQEALRDHKSKYRKWFYFKRWSHDYLSFLDFKELPKIRLTCKEAREHITGAALYWLEKGADGFRLDHAIGPPHSFWKSFSNEVKAHNPDAVLIGEAWMEGIRFSHLNTLRLRNRYLRWLYDLNPRQIQREYAGELDGVLDFRFRSLVTEHIAHAENPAAHLPPLSSELRKHYAYFPEGYFLPSFVDNHDMSRFMFEAGQEKEKLKAALTFQFQQPQPPILYYGTETALSHDRPVDLSVPHSDLYARKPMPWSRLDTDMVKFCMDLIRKRKIR